MPPLVEKVVERSASPIQKFYAGANVFVTGGTGFLGRLLIEKLLRSCPELANVYVLVRSKKDKGPHERLDELLDCPTFRRLREERPKFRHKVVGVNGDCSLPELGIDEQDRKLLTTEVSVVFHVAATVRFDEKLKSATAINVRGTRELLRLCKEMTRLKAVAHVSTAYSNCAETIIEEVFYPTPIDSGKLVVLADCLGDRILEDVTAKILGNFPNTYAFTKAVAEHVVQEEGKGLPVAVYRPSIVISTYKEPICGWINNLYGPTGVTAGAGSGVIRTLHCDPEVNANIVPADLCVNGLIAVPWEVEEAFAEAAATGKAFDVPVYQYESSTERPISWGKFMHFAERYGIPSPSINAVWYYSFTLRKHYVANFLAVLFLHYLPAFLVDAVLYCAGKKPRFVKLYKKIDRFSRVISYFSTKNFSFRSTRMRSLLERMSSEDRDMFGFDLSKLDWEEFMRTYMVGIRLYLMKDTPDTLDAAVKRYERLHWYHRGCKLLLSFVVLRIAWSVIASFW